MPAGGEPEAAEVVACHPLQSTWRQGGDAVLEYPDASQARNETQGLEGPTAGDVGGGGRRAAARPPADGLPSSNQRARAADGSTPSTLRQALAAGDFEAQIPSLLSGENSVTGNNSLREVPEAEPVEDPDLVSASAVLDPAEESVIQRLLTNNRRLRRFLFVLFLGIIAGTAGVLQTMEPSSTPKSAECRPYGSLECYLEALDKKKTTSVNITKRRGYIPERIGDLSRLTSLDLSSNQISGTIPSTIGRLTKLEELILNGYHDGDNWVLTGTLPPALGLLTALTRLSLSHNDLSGALPVELSRLSELEDFDFTDLLSDGRAHERTIPSEYGLLTSLTHLKIDRFSDALPTELGQLTALEELILKDNSFDSNIPSEFGQLTALTTLQLYLNNHAASALLLPTEPLGGVSNLASLSDDTVNRTISEINTGESKNLGHVSFGGTIPLEIAHLTSLTDLILSDCRLGGTLPTVLGRLTVLQRLWISRSGRGGVKGTLPTEFGNLQHLQDLDVSENGLSGKLPDELSNLTRLTSLDVSRNKDLESFGIPESLCFIPVISRVCGTECPCEKSCKWCEFDPSPDYVT